MNALECLLTAEKKDTEKHGLWIGKGMRETDENNVMNQIRMIKPKGWVTVVEIETIKRKIENEISDDVNDGTIHENDNTTDIYDENHNIKDA